MRSMVEGRPSFALRDDQTNDHIHITEHVPRSDPQDAKAGPFEIGLAEKIDASPVATRVRLTIDFNQKTGGQTGEIRDVSGDGVLTTEPVAVWS